jgi:hypothetical protein
MLTEDELRRLDTLAHERAVREGTAALCGGPPLASLIAQRASRIRGESKDAT